MPFPEGTLFITARKTSRLFRCRKSLAGRALRNLPVRQTVESLGCGDQLLISYRALTFRKTLLQLRQQSPEECLNERGYTFHFQLFMKRAVAMKRECFYLLLPEKRPCAS